MIIYHAALELSVLKKFYETFQEPLNVLFIGNEKTLKVLKDYRYRINKTVLDSGAWNVTHGSSNLNGSSKINRPMEVENP